MLFKLMSYYVFIKQITPKRKYKKKCKIMKKIKYFIYKKWNYEKHGISKFIWNKVEQMNS